MAHLRDTKTENDALTPDPVKYHIDPFSKSLIHCDNRAQFLNSPKSYELRDYIYSLIQKYDVEVLSLDVFDTLLLRNDKPEAQRYMEMSELCLNRLREKFPKTPSLHSLSPEDFCEARIMGMRATYRTRPLVQGCGEGHIEEVYAMQKLLLGLQEEEIAVLRNVEIEYEAANLTLNPLLAEVAEWFRSNGGKVILLSDMYLGADMIAAIIERLCEKPLYDHLFSSADLVISKRCGKVFAYVEQKLGIPGERILHMGDSWIGDVERPRQAGWKAMHFPISRKELGRRQQALLKFISDMHEKGFETRDWAKL